MIPVNPEMFSFLLKQDKIFLMAKHKGPITPSVLLCGVEKFTEFLWVSVSLK